MSDQIVLAWTVNVAGSSFGPTQAAAALAAVDLYENTETDPVLGQLFGLTVTDDATTNDATSATRTLTLNMTGALGSPTAPPPFPCHPRTSTPPELPYPLREAVTLPGSFFVQTGSTTVDTTETQIPSLNVGDAIEFLAQEGVFYTVAGPITATSCSLTAPYTGTTGNSEAFKEVAAPVALNRLAIYSSSDLDTNGVLTTPAIPAGSGAHIVELLFLDSTGAGPFAAEAELTGRRPVSFIFDEPTGTDVAVIVGLLVVGTGTFDNNVGELTLVALSDDLPIVPTNTTPGTGFGSIEGTAPAIGIRNTFTELTDQAQMLIDRHLAYLPPSYFSLAQQGASVPALDGDFIVTTGSKNVPTTVDQTGSLAAGNIVEFAAQPRVQYEIAAVTAKAIQLTTPFTGIDTNNTGDTITNGTKGNVSDTLDEKPTGAVLIDPSPAAPPTDAQLAAPLAQFVAQEVATPPPNPPLSPATVSTPTFLSNFFTKTIQLALKGVPVSPAVITFA